MSIQSIEARLRRIEREGEQLRKQLEARKAKEYGAIPGKYGFKSMDAFIAALSEYAGREPSTAPKSVAKDGQDSTAGQRANKPQRGRPSRYTDAQRAAVKAALEKGGKTVPELSKEHGVNEYVIVEWKKKWGLVNPRKKAASRAKKK